MEEANERKRKLDEIRKKKAKYKKLLEGKEPSNPLPSKKDPALETPPKDEISSNSEVSTPSNSTNTSFIKTHTKRNSFLDNSKNIRLLEIHIKKINESLRESRSEHFLQGIYPVLKSEETQYKLPEEFEEEKRQEELLKQQQEKNKKNTTFARRASTKGMKEILKKTNLIQFGKQKILEGIKKLK